MLSSQNPIIMWEKQGSQFLDLPTHRRFHNKIGPLLTLHFVQKQTQNALLLNILSGLSSFPLFVLEWDGQLMNDGEHILQSYSYTLKWMKFPSQCQLIAWMRWMCFLSAPEKPLRLLSNRDWLWINEWEELSRFLCNRNHSKINILNGA